MKVEYLGFIPILVVIIHLMGYDFYEGRWRFSNFIGWLVIVSGISITVGGFVWGILALMK